jgi:hypothetical protein
MTDKMQALYDKWRNLGISADRRARKRLPQSALFWALVIAIPPSTIVTTHLWLRSAYSGDLFHLQGFLNQYDYGIYRYRLLGRDALLFIYRHLLGAFHDRPYMMPRDPNATQLFYASYVLMDALCFSLSNFLLLLLLSDRKRHLSDQNLAMYLYLTLIQTLAMAVVTPYDQLAYLLILTSLLAVTLPGRWVGYAILGLAALAGGLTRETQFLVTPALFSAALFSTGRRSRHLWAAGLINLAVFGLVYIALRVFLPGSDAVAGGNTYGGKWAFESLFALALLFFVSTSLAVRMHADIRPTVALLIFSSPYIVAILISGVLRELRLLVPILLAQTFVYVELQLDSGREARSTAASEPPQGPQNLVPEAR